MRYIVDFVCFELMLVIEVDGIAHDDPEAEKKDKERDSALRSVGFSVLRFSDWEVLHQLPEVSLLIQDWIAKNKH